LREQAWRDESRQRIGVSRFDPGDRARITARAGLGSATCFGNFGTTADDEEDRSLTETKEEVGEAARLYTPSWVGAGTPIVIHACFHACAREADDLTDRSHTDIPAAGWPGIA
jgi:hypothetical protein